MYSNDLLFRRQYLIVTKEVDGIKSWKKTIIHADNKDFIVYTHPVLNILTGKNEIFELVLLGYFLDPFNPAFTDNDIINELLKCTTFIEITVKLASYNGRFALIYSARDQIRIVNDATCFREVYYYLGKDITAVGSTPNIIAEHLNLEESKSGDLYDFINSSEFVENDSTLVGYKTLYEGIYNLPPNHFLDLIKHKIERFWPSTPLTRISLEECVENCSRILKGTIDSAVNRYNIHVGLTSGWDTRLLLAATKDHKDRIFYYTNKRTIDYTASRDITIPQKIADKLRFKLNFVEISEEISDEFRKIVFRNNILASRKLKLLPVYYEVYKRGWQDTFTVGGTMGNGLARIYQRIPKGYEHNGKNLARLIGFETIKYVEDELDDWAKSVNSVCEKYNIDIMDLFQLEQENSHWAALESSEQDIVRDEIRIFNNRQLIENFWSLDEKYRFQYYPVIYIELIRKLWKEALEVPINPSLKNTLYKILNIFGWDVKVYNYFKRRHFLASIKKYG